MTENRIPLLYSSAHSQHAPPVELWNGKLVNYPEVPRRIETIRESLEPSGLVDITPMMRWSRKTNWPSCTIVACSTTLKRCPPVLRAS